MQLKIKVFSILILLFFILFEKVSCQSLKSRRGKKDGRNGSNSKCEKPNGNFPDPVQCDAYFQCRKGIAEKIFCPKGLMFNGKVDEGYPCSYPQEVDCGKREQLQEADSNEDCPNQNGLFRESEDSEDCDGYINCVSGQAFRQKCPEGLAFSPSTARCEWPDEVKECDAEAYLGFKCPEIDDKENKSDGERQSREKGSKNKKKVNKKRNKREVHKKQNARISWQYFKLGSNNVIQNKTFLKTNKPLTLTYTRSTNATKKRNPSLITSSSTNYDRDELFYSHSSNQYLKNFRPNHNTNHKPNPKPKSESNSAVDTVDLSITRKKSILISRGSKFKPQNRFLERNRNSFEKNSESESDRSWDEDDEVEESKVNRKRVQKTNNKDDEGGSENKSDNSGSGSGNDEEKLKDDNPKYPHTDDCRKFFVCIKGTKPRLMKCSFGEVFNPETSNCDDQENVDKCDDYYPNDVIDGIKKLKSFDKKVFP